MRRVVVLPGSLGLAGAGRQSLLLARGLQEQHGAQVRVLPFRVSAGGDDWCRRHGIGWEQVTVDWDAGRARRILSLLELARHVRKLRPHVILPFTMRPNVACGLVWRLTGAGLCLWNQRDEGRQRVAPRWERAAVRLTPLFASNSTHGAAFLSDVLGVATSRIRIILNGVQLADAQCSRSELRRKLGIADSAYLACMLANLHGFKDHDTLLETWRIVLDRWDMSSGQPVLLLAGLDAGGATALKAKAFDLGLGRSVVFAGWVSDVGGLLQASDLCVFSSVAEGVPNGVLEGMAAGLPVVATDYAGITEAAGDSGCALLTPPRDAGLMAEAVLTVAADRAMARRMGEAGQERIRTEFSLEKMVRETTEWIEEGLRRHGR